MIKDNRPKMCLVRFSEGYPQTKIKHTNLLQKGWCSTEWARVSPHCVILEYYVPSNFEEIKDTI